MVHFKEENRGTIVLLKIEVEGVRPNIAYSTMPRKYSWVKKRRSETAKAASQQKNRRKNTIYKRAAEYSLECKADTLVAIQIRKTGEIYVFDSTGGRWLGTLSRLVFCTEVW
ncbi:Pc13g00830 [Penicillium rubens Wisconsin 54-1255]|uniref:Pc13g00830 protein n=2 Tax=Penicillium rubens TaxID=1108849 RepID=B6H163_PENRW|nr:Pc13g00830 [Penicillium rubens Wisconsin 54-1255]